MKKRNQAGLVAGLMLFAAGCANPGPMDNPEDFEAAEAAIKPLSVCVDHAIKDLGIDMNMNADPALVAEILHDDMLLDDLPAAAAMFSTATQQPVSLQPMLEEIRSAILEKHPAVAEFLCAAVDAKLIPKVKDPESAALVNRVVHHTYILNEITEQMANSFVFQYLVQMHLMAKRAGFGIRPDLVGSLEDLKALYGGEMFGPTKVVSMDLANALLIKMRSEGAVTPQYEATLKGAIKLNILEAAVTEKQAGYQDNAMAGAVLAAIPPQGITLQDGTRNAQFGFSQGWNSLYETWNLAFITGNATYLNIYYPKLLIPSVIAADAPSYIGNRAMSLWVSLNFRQFAALRGQPNLQVPNKEAMTQVWGAINYKYAEQLALDETGYPMQAFAPMLEITLAQIMAIMKQSFSAVPLTPEEQARLEALYQ